MPKLIFEKDDNGLRITLLNAAPSVVRNATPNSENFQVRFDLGNDSVTVELTPSALQTLGLQCLELMPRLGAQYTEPSVEDVYRQPAYRLKYLDDHSIKLLLREIQSDSLVDFLWYMKDADLIKLMLRNMPKRASEMLMDDLDIQWRDKNPDNALVADAKRGREAIHDIMATVRHLIAENQIQDIFGEGNRTMSNGIMAV